MRKNNIFMSNLLILYSILHVVNYFKLSFCLFILILLIQLVFFSLQKNMSDKQKSNVISIPSGKEREILLNRLEAIEEIMVFKACTKTHARHYFDKLKEHNCVFENNKINWGDLFAMQ